jgi:hypothetical protein
MSDVIAAEYNGSIKYRPRHATDINFTGALELDACIALAVGLDD